VARRFGKGILKPGGAVDRQALGAIDFADPRALRDLERITHPAVRDEVKAFLAASQAPVAVIEAIKLLESELRLRCDEIWVVTCPPDEQLHRLIERGLAPADAGQRVRAQAGMVERLAASATLVLDTGGRPAVARRHVEEALEVAIARHVVVTGDRSRGGPEGVTEPGSAPAS
jgi:dephospho-CoA kinase